VLLVVVEADPLLTVAPETAAPVAMSLTMPEMIPLAAYAPRANNMHKAIDKLKRREYFLFINYLFLVLCFLNE
jgi:hypothetical protein